MKILLGCWDTFNLNPSMSENIRKKTLHYTKTSVESFRSEFPKDNHQAKIYITESVNELIKTAFEEKSDFLIFFPSGTIIYNPKSLYEGFKKYLENTFDLAGHLIDHYAQNSKNSLVKGLFGLHEQCLILSKKLIEEIINQNITINDKSFFYKDLSWPNILRSEENIHNDYTPLWIKKGEGKTSVEKNPNSRFCLFYDLIKFCLINNFSVGNLPREFRTPRQYSYHLDNPKSFEDLINSKQESFEKTPKGQLEFIERWKKMLNPELGFWAWNTESIDVDENLTVDCFITVASGLMPLYYLANFSTGEKCKIIYVDINKNCLDFQKYLLENLFVKSDSYEELVEDFKSQRKISHFGSPSQTDYKKMVDAIRKKWKEIKSFDYEFLHQDILSLSEKTKQDIKNSKYPYIWFSNVLRYIPNLNTIYEESTFQSYILELMNLNLNINWKGISLSNFRTNGPNSAVHIKNYSFYKTVNHIVPSEDLMKDIEKIESLNLFVPHRDQDNIKGIKSHRGWASFVIHGLGYDKTEGYERYGYKNEFEAPYDFTPEALEHCPNFIRWLKENKFKEKYHRVRIMKLEPNGMVGIHRDNPESNTWATNFAVNNPLGCEMHFWNKEYEYLGVVPWESGKVFRIRIGDNHCVINKSNQNRYHIIIHGAGGWI